jgi:hypothetical protein
VGLEPREEGQRDRHRVDRSLCLAGAHLDASGFKVNVPPAEPERLTGTEGCVVAAGDGRELRGELLENGEDIGSFATAVPDWSVRDEFFNSDPPSSGS